MNRDKQAQESEVTADDFFADFLNPNPLETKASESTTRATSTSITDLVLEGQIIDALQNVYDPELPVNIYDLGLIYSININADKSIDIEMTLTTPGCPVAQTFPGTVECAVKCVEGVEDVHVELVWDPPWTKDRMSEDALLSLGLL